MIEILDCEQGSPAWFAARAGRVTASELHTVLAKGRDGGASVTRRAYMLRLAGEIITGEASESYSNANMERGKVMEAEARERYAFERDCDPQIVGFVHSKPLRAGCSPDALVGEDGGLEVKTKQPNVLIDVMLRGGFPPEHRAQCQGFLWITGREWIDLACYWPKLPLVVSRATRDEEYIAALAAGVRQFNDELDAVVEKVRRYGQPDAAKAA